MQISSGDVPIIFYECVSAQNENGYVERLPLENISCPLGNSFLYKVWHSVRHFYLFFTSTHFGTKPLVGHHDFWCRAKIRHLIVFSWIREILITLSLCLNTRYVILSIYYTSLFESWFFYFFFDREIFWVGCKCTTSSYGTGIHFTTWTLVTYTKVEKCGLYTVGQTWAKYGLELTSSQPTVSDLPHPAVILKSK